MKDGSAYPRRIQRRRVKGWKMPEGAVYVGRPSRWGNPFRVVHTAQGWTVIDDNDVEYDDWPTQTAANRHAVSLFYMDVKGELAPYPPLSDLCGKDLVCWCPLDAPCHADVLLELANAGVDRG